MYLNLREHSFTFKRLSFCKSGQKIPCKSHKICNNEKYSKNKYFFFSYETNARKLLRIVRRRNGGKRYIQREKKKKTLETAKQTSFKKSDSDLKRDSLRDT